VGRALGVVLAGEREIVVLGMIAVDKGWMVGMGMAFRHCAKRDVGSFLRRRDSLEEGWGV
jgi:hypothetical protein